MNDLDLFVYVRMKKRGRQQKIISLMFKLSEKYTEFEKNLLRGLYIYLVNVQTLRKIFSNFVCFSESPNFILLKI